MSDLVFVLFVQLQAGREVTRLKWSFQRGTLFLASFWWIRREAFPGRKDLKMAGIAAVKLLYEVRERLAVLLQIE